MQPWLDWIRWADGSNVAFSDHPERRKIGQASQSREMELMVVRRAVSSHQLHGGLYLRVRRTVGLVGLHVGVRMEIGQVTFLCWSDGMMKSLAGSMGREREDVMLVRKCRVFFSCDARDMSSRESSHCAFLCDLDRSFCILIPFLTSNRRQIDGMMSDFAVFMCEFLYRRRGWPDVNSRIDQVSGGASPECDELAVGSFPAIGAGPSYSVQPETTAPRSPSLLPESHSHLNLSNTIPSCPSAPRDDIVTL